MIQDLGGNIDTKDAMNETPAHTCARYGNQEALAYLHANTRKSFEVLNQNNEKPADVANERAQLFFAKLEAQQKTEEANQASEKNSWLLARATNMTETCKDGFRWVALRNCNYLKVNRTGHCGEVNLMQKSSQNIGIYIHRFPATKALKIIPP